MLTIELNWHKIKNKHLLKKLQAKEVNIYKSDMVKRCVILFHLNKIFRYFSPKFSSHRIYNYSDIVKNLISFSTILENDWKTWMLWPYNIRHIWMKLPANNITNIDISSLLSRNIERQCLIARIYQYRLFKFFYFFLSFFYYCRNFN